ncbi:MAG: hypothetical protein ACOCVF_02565 [bacterium]
MKKECFTCKNKLVEDLDNLKRQKLIKEERKLAKTEKRWPKRIPEQLYFCDITKKQINQIDPACEHYEDHSQLVEIRKLISEKAKELRKELK